MRRVPTVVLVGVAALGIAGAGLLLLPAGGTAQTAPAPQQPPSTATTPAAGAADPLFVAFEGDAVAGQRVVMGASGAGVGSACFSCHGLRGEGDGAGGFPRLAGQPAWYLYKQLQDYASGSRPNEVMTPIAARMTQQERRDVAAYYAAALAEHRGPLGRHDPELLQRGASIAAIGSPQRGVQSCAGCHGPNGTGLPPDSPYLAGLGAAYLELQLRLWAEGRRRNDAFGMMADVAKRLSDEERRAVAAYFSALPPPAQP